MSTDNLADDDFLDERRPLSKKTKVEFAKFTEPVPVVDTTAAAPPKTPTTFHTYYIRNVTASEVYSFIRSVLTNHRGENTSMLTYFQSRMDFLTKHEEIFNDLENPTEPIVQYDVGTYFTAWTCVCIALFHLITKTFEFKQEGAVNHTVALAFLSLCLEVVPLVYANKVSIFQDIMQFKLGVLNLCYLALKLIFEIISIGVGSFFSTLFLIITHGVFVILVNFRLWNTIDRKEDYRLAMLTMLIIEITGYALIAILDTVL